jgi:hypothetical protein
MEAERKILSRRAKEEREAALKAKGRAQRIHLRLAELYDEAASKLEKRPRA